MSGNSRILAPITEGSPSLREAKCLRSGRIVMQATGRRIKKPSHPPPWAELPFDVTTNILHRLGTIEILESAQYVCKSWHIVCNDPSMWRAIDIPESSGRTYADLRRMCRQAVNLSQGQLVDINLECFASDELLDYIAERSEKLRRFRLVIGRCHRLSDDGLKKTIERFRYLDEFRIILTPHSHIYDVEGTAIETIGTSCPLLRSFALIEKSGCFRNAPFDEAAYAIARSMPELRHLQLRGQGLTDSGLEAILDGCRHLESLDLKVCYVGGNGDDLMKRCKRCLTQFKCRWWTADHNTLKIAWGVGGFDR